MRIVWSHCLRLSAGPVAFVRHVQHMLMLISCLTCVVAWMFNFFLSCLTVWCVFFSVCYIIDTLNQVVNRGGIPPYNRAPLTLGMTPTGFSTTSHL